MRKYSVFDIGKNQDYFDSKKNIEVITKVARKCYLPTNKLMLDLINRHNGKFKIAYSITGVALEQFENFAPEVLQSFKDLIKTGCVELLSETYHHSLAFFYSKEEFKEQILLHKKKLKKEFNYKPTIFRNTELVYNNELASIAEKMGYEGILAEGADHILGWRSPNFVYTPQGTKKIKLLLKNYKLSDDIAFRFSNKSWNEWPLTVDKFSQWLNSTNGNGNTVNLFMDYETFGEHQWEDTGIFHFMEQLPGELLKHPDNNFKTPSEVIKSYDPVAQLDIPYAVSWADLERDTSAWLGNKMQQAAAKELYLIEKEIKKTRDKEIIDNWRKLTTSDHLYYMCTKWFSDGDVHKYFNPYDSPYDSFIAFMNVLNDLIIRTKQQGMKRSFLKSLVGEAQKIKI
jgi:alpha-amylase